MEDTRAKSGFIGKLSAGSQLIQPILAVIVTIVGSMWTLYLFPVLRTEAKAKADLTKVELESHEISNRIKGYVDIAVKMTVKQIAPSAQEPKQRSQKTILLELEFTNLGTRVETVVIRECSIRSIREVDWDGEIRQGDARRFLFFNTKLMEVTIVPNPQPNNKISSIQQLWGSGLYGIKCDIESKKDSKISYAIESFAMLQ